VINANCLFLYIHLKFNMDQRGLHRRNFWNLSFL
jgi:hypothetical protein